MLKAGFIFVIVTLAVDINDGENEKMTNTFLIVDGNSLMHRAFHALPLMDADGVYTNAIYGFLSMLLKAVKEEEAAYLAICFDEHGPTFRHQIYAEYKAGRAATPPELRQQFPRLRVPSVQGQRARGALLRAAPAGGAARTVKNMLSSAYRMRRAQPGTVPAG